MARYRHNPRGEITEWDEHLYHRSLEVTDNEVTTTDELDIDHLGRRGWWEVEEEEETTTTTTTTEEPTTTTTTTEEPTTTTTTTAAPEE